MLRQRAEFLKVAASGRKWVTPGLVLQIDAPSLEKASVPHAPVIHFGLTASKKVGNAVMRNRAKRRLRALVREILGRHGKAEQAYVLIARPTTPTRAFDDLRNDLVTALKKLKSWREEG